MLKDTATKGVYYIAGSSAAIPALAEQQSNGVIHLRAVGENGPDKPLDRILSPEDYLFGDVIPGVAVELRLRDGGIFEPENVQFHWNMRHSEKTDFLARLESNWKLVAASFVINPCFIWWMIAIGIPGGAERLVPLLPDSVSQSASKQTMALFERLDVLEDTKLDHARQDQIHAEWQSAQERLGMRYDADKLLLRHAPSIGANAFALPDGTIVVTDQLISLLEEKEDALLAVLLHEQGHVHHQHGLKLAARSAATALFFSLLLGDIQGAGELVIGASSSLLDSAFSRDMEREADSYSLEKLTQLGKSPHAFADAMKGFQSVAGEDDNENILKYLSTHPSTQQRIETAEEAARSEAN